MKTFYALAFMACVGIALLNPAESTKPQPVQLTAQQRYEVMKRQRQGLKDLEACMAIRRNNPTVRCSAN